MHPTLTALLSLLTTAVTDLDKLYESNNVPFPSLDEPSPQADIFSRGNTEGLKASMTIVAVCHQLTNLVQTPQDLVRQASVGFLRSACIKTVIECNISEILHEFGGEHGLHIDRIADISGADGSKLGRVLRFLATIHIFRETSPDVFANNRNSFALDSGRAVAELNDPTNKFTEAGRLATACLHSTDFTMPTAVHMSEIIRRPNEAYSMSAFNRFVKSDIPFFTWINLPENKDKLERFNFAMAIHRTNTIPSDGFQWSTLETGAHIVDVGGGMGFATLALFKEHPGLRYTIQDLPAVVEASKMFWLKKAPQAILTNSVIHGAHSFFEEQPVRGADVYFLRAVIHNWPDDAAIKILSRLRAAASKSSKLVIVDKVVDYACPANALPELDIEDSDATFAPYPLLSNWGTAADFADLVYSLDILMLMHFGDAKERTVLQWKHIFQEAGWKLTHIYRGSFAHCVGEPI